MKKAYNILIQGRVQGVGFRWFAQQNAQQFGLQGYVENLHNGDVEVFVQGSEESLQQFIAKLKVGPSFANVTNFNISDTEVDNSFNQFKVKH